MPEVNGTGGQGGNENAGKSTRNKAFWRRSLRPIKLDPVLSGFNMPLLIKVPITEEVPHVDAVQVGNVTVTLTPADHAWKNESPKHHTRDKMEDYCGFWLDTPDGSIWAVGDSRLMEEQLHMPCPDAMLFDISDSRWHIGLDGVKKIGTLGISFVPVLEGEPPSCGHLTKGHLARSGAE